MNFIGTYNYGFSPINTHLKEFFTSIFMGRLNISHAILHSF